MREYDDMRLCDAFWGRIRDHTISVRCRGHTTRCIRVLTKLYKTVYNYIWLQQGHSNARVALTNRWNRMWNTIFPIRGTERRPLYHWLHQGWSGRRSVHRIGKIVLSKSGYGFRQEPTERVKGVNAPRYIFFLREGPCSQGASWAVCGSGVPPYDFFNLCGVFNNRFCPSFSWETARTKEP